MAFLAIGVTLVALARGLPPHAFFVGDPGVKLIAARNVINYPTRPFEIPLPTIGVQPVPHVDPFFAIHGDHTHAVTPELFPLITAPFVAAFGVRGASLLPAAGLLLALAATVWLALALDRRRSPLVVLLTTFLATPLLFYGLEFWEHAPAAGVSALAIALFVRASNVGPNLLAGFLFGIATLLRPEALWFAVSVLACAPLLPSPPRRRAIALAVLGIAAALVPLEIYTLTHFGSPIPPHIAGNPAIVSTDWLAIRGQVISSWFGADRLTSFWRVAPAILLAFLPVNFFSTGAGEQLGGRAFLVGVALIDSALVVLTAPNDGGGQWGPRYLLLAYIPLAILASDAVSYLVSRLSWTFDVGSAFPGAPTSLRQGFGGPPELQRRRKRRWREGGRRIVAVAFVSFVALAGIWIQRAAYKELRAAKMTYARLVDFVAREVPAGGYAITDLWWLDQVAAALTDSRRILYVRDASAAADALQRLDRITEPNVVIIQSRVESSEPLKGSLHDTCYIEDASRDIPERTLTVIHLRRSCASRMNP